MAEIKHESAQKKVVTHIVNPETWKKAQEKAFAKVGKRVKVKGFREGKVPVDVLKKHVKPQDVQSEALDSILQAEFEAVLEATGLAPFIRPRVDISKISDTEVELVFTIFVEPEITMPQYKGRNIVKEEIKVSDAEVEAEVKKLLATHGDLILKEGPVAEGDTVVMDFEGFVNGVPFDGGKAANHELEVGSKTFIPGFEEQLVGHKAGESFDVNVKFPSNYHAELKDKDATFKIVLHEVKEKKTPELSDEFAKSLNIHDVNDVDTLYKHVKKDVLSVKEKEATKNIVTKLLNDLVNEATVELAEEILQEEITTTEERLSRELEQEKIGREDYIKSLNMTEDEYHAKLHLDATTNLKRMLLLRNIIKAEKIEITDADLEFEYSKIADQYKMEIAKVKEILGPQEDHFRNDLLFKRLEEFLVFNNTK